MINMKIMFGNCEQKLTLNLLLLVLYVMEIKEITELC